MNPVPRSWTLRNKLPFNKAKTQQISVTNGKRCNVAIHFYVNHGRLNHPESLTVLPKWKLQANIKPKLTTSYDLVYASHLLEASLANIQGVTLPKPFLTMTYQKPNQKSRKRVTVMGRILGIKALSNDDPHYDRYQGVYLTLIVRLCQKCQLSTNLRKIQLDIRGKLLPIQQFQYGVCDKIRSKFRRCTDSEYLTNPGRGVIPNVGAGGGSNMCHVFYRRDHQSPHTYCSFDVTTS
jgi:hypothetical protein